MKKLYTTFVISILVFQSLNLSAQCSGTKFTSQIIDSTKTAIFTNTTTVTFHTYYWTFGDGQTSTVKSPTHQYAQSGKYWVELRGIDTVKKCYDTTGKWISIGCKSSFNYSSDGTKLSYNTSNPGAFKIRFDFGDGTSSGSSSGNHTYAGFGTYNVCLTVYCTTTDSTKSCQSVIIKSNCVAAFYINNKDSVGKTKFTFDNRSTTSPGMKYFWDLGDGSTATTIGIYEHTYAVGTYTICLTISDTAKKCSDSVCQTLNVGKHCDSGFSYSSLADTLFYTYTGKAANVKLYFGDGKTSTTKSGKHIYGKLGTFNICLTAYCSSTDSSKLCRSVNLVAIPCKAKFTKSVDTSQKFKIYLINNSTNTSTTTYKWDFGDGSSSTSRNPTHKYSTFGKFNVCLQIRDNSCFSFHCDTIGLDSSGKLLKAGSFELVVIDQSSSINKIKLETNFKVFPNPTCDKVTIELLNLTTPYNKIEVLDAIGKVLILHPLNKEQNTIDLDLSLIKDGIYIIKISSTQEYSYIKIIKN